MTTLHIDHVDPAGGPVWGFVTACLVMSDVTSAEVVKRKQAVVSTHRAAGQTSATLKF